MITLYDLPSKVADSPGTMITWRTRYCLNLKNLPYQTVYVEIPDVEALAKKIGAAPTSLWPDGDPPNTRSPSSRTTPQEPAHSTNLPLLRSRAHPPGTLALQLAFTDTVEAAFEHLRLPLFYADFATKAERRDRQRL
ncbi:hypothetical protein EV421DRAFT_2015483 [Armillaria borealis]|uniref:GST N-terminal domain-containing protein n=1 Tax=Armillaria borealis TaxID=47425 RepID=A0AA39K171_9AGAR|nr:hypothetical protein EV421DRAFT_2015483 [Armillaria borealis]